VSYQDEQDVPVQDLYSRNVERRANGIKSWEPELRPREKMLERGRDTMSNAELLAILIGSGTPRETAVDLAGRILDGVSGNLLKLSDLELADFCRFAGMGVAKACSILAAMELAKRMCPMLNVVPVKKVQVSSGAGIRPAID
jgi:DNA repair protein RadC